MTLASQINDLANRIGAEIKALRPSGGGRAVGKGELVFNVADYGARSDTTSTSTPGADNRDAIQAALDACSAAGGGTVHFPAGGANSWYHISAGAPLRISSNTWIRAEKGATIRKISGVCFAFYVWAGTNSGYGSGASNCRVTGLRFWGGFASGNVFAAFAFNNAQDILIEDCVFDQVQGNAHTMDIQGSENITIRNCKFIGGAMTTSPYAECLQVDASVLGSASTADTTGSYSGLFCRNVTVEGCQFLPVTVGGNDYPCPNPLGSHARSEGRYHENIKFLNNVVLDPCEQVSASDGDNAGYMYGVIHMATVKGLLISGNTFRQTKARSCRVISIHSISNGGAAANDPNTTGTPAVDYAPVTSDDIKITDNVFAGFTQSSNQQEIIWINGIGTSDGYVQRVAIRGNTFKGGWVGLGSDVVKAACIAARYMSGCVVEGNHFQDTHLGLNLLSSHHIQAGSNQFYGIGSLAFYATFCSNVKIVGNGVFGCGRGIHLHNGTTDAAIVGNTIKDPPVGGTQSSSTGIAVSGSAARVVVNGNTLSSAISSAGPAIFAGTLSGNTPTDVGIVGNKITGFTTPMTPTRTASGAYGASGSIYQMANL